jgi:hypothetical protein
MRRKTVGALVCVAALGLLGAGCGGDDGDDDGAAQDEATTVKGELTKPEYIAEGDQICAEGTARIAKEALDRYGDTQPSLEEIDEFAREVVAPVLQEQVDQLRALPPPKGDDETVAAIYAEVQEGIDALREDPSLLASPASGGAFNDANRLAQDYGFRQCGSA